MKGSGTPKNQVVATWWLCWTNSKSLEAVWLEVNDKDLSKGLRVCKPEAQLADTLVDTKNALKKKEKSNSNFKQKREGLCLSKECVRTAISLWRKTGGYWLLNVLRTSVSFLNDWNLITTILTDQGNTRVGMWRWNELGSSNLDPKQDLGRKLYFFFQCLLRADLMATPDLISHGRECSSEMWEWEKKKNVYSSLLGLEN